MDLKFMQDLHNKEFSARENLAQRANTIITGITTLGGVLAFIAVNFKSGDHPSACVIFWLLAAASSVALAFAAYYLIWSYRVPPLTDISRPKEWLSYWKELQQQVKDGKIASADAEFTDYLMQQYADIGEGNIDANFKRGTRLVKSNNSLLVSFVLIVLTALTFYLNNYILAASTNIFAKEGTEMLTYENALIPKNVLNSGGQNGPKPRPVPSPGPNPMPQDVS